MEKFAKEHADLAEDLSTAMERSVSNMKKVQSRGKPSQAISKPEYPFKAAKKFLQYRGKWCIIES
jgi:hypothetical protein